VPDIVQILLEGTLIRTHTVKHGPNKEPGAFATPTGRLRRKKAA
jgi:hypothetical protein